LGHRKAGLLDRSELLSLIEAEDVAEERCDASGCGANVRRRLDRWFRFSGCGGWFHDDNSCRKTTFPQAQ
jgi:hypothetical protein